MVDILAIRTEINAVFSTDIGIVGTCAYALETIIARIGIQGTIGCSHTDVCD